MPCIPCRSRAPRRCRWALKHRKRVSPAGSSRRWSAGAMVDLRIRMRSAAPAVALILGAVAFALATPALAAPAGLPAFTSAPAAGGGQAYSLSIQTLVLLTALSFLPAVILMM